MNHSRMTGGPFLDRLLQLQFDDWLQDNLLLRQDKNTMASSLELRCPFLDHRVIEQAFRMPPRMKVRGLRDKWVERELGKKWLPPENVKRSKNPFYLPLEYFHEHPELRDLIRMTLSREAVAKRGWFDPGACAWLVDRMETGEFLYLKQVHVTRHPRALASRLHRQGAPLVAEVGRRGAPRGTRKMILVTGGAGVMGSRLVRGPRRGRQRGARPHAAERPAREPPRRPGVDIRYGDVGKRETLEGLLDGVRTVYHLAAVLLAKDPAVFERVNVGGTRNLVDLSIKAGVQHFILVSSISVTYPYTTPYSLSKRECERIVKDQTAMR